MNMTKEEELSYSRYNEIRAREIGLWENLREQKLGNAIIKHLPAQVGLMLEAGAGDGYLLHYLRKHNLNFHYNATDISETRTKRIKDNAPFCNIVKGDICSLPYKDNTFDLTICSQTLEHIPNHQEAVSEIFRVTNAEGYVLITVPNEEELILIECPHCGKEFYQWGHVASFDKKSIRTLIANAGGGDMTFKYFFTSDFRSIALHYCRLILSLLLGRPQWRKPPFLLCCAKKRGIIENQPL
jgi:ubiquinone/menaquinone biosynthesis C-methylase UbiE